MPVAKITPMGEHGLYHVHFLDGRTDPGFGQGGGGHPDQGLPGYGHPDQGLPGQGGHPGNRPPGSGAHPGNRPPGSGGGGIPDNELPEAPPPHLLPGYTLVMVRGPHGKWEYAFIAPGDPPPKPLPPGSIEHPGNRPPGSGITHPDQGLPGSQPHPDQGLPGGPPHASGQPTPPQPTPTPQRR